MISITVFVLSLIPTIGFFILAFNSLFDEGKLSVVGWEFAIFFWAISIYLGTQLGGT